MIDQDRIAARLLAWESLDSELRSEDPAALLPGNLLLPENAEEAAELRRRVELLRKFDAAFGPPIVTLPFDDAAVDGAAVDGVFPSVPGCEIRGVLGRGGMGVVYRAWQQDLQREVAVKVLRRTAGNAAQRSRRFAREARVLARLRHDHIVPVYDAALHLGEPYFVMELMTGGSLAKARDRFAEPKAAAALLERVARAVRHAHNQEVLHRDLKPANILLDEHGRPRVSDFGLAKLFNAEDEDFGTRGGSISDDPSTDDGGDHLTTSNAVVGTPPYMAPEQFGSERLGPAVDIWGLGVVLYEILTGRRPFVARNHGDLRSAILHDPPPRPRSLRPEIPPALEAIVLKCLAKEPADRYPDAGALADDLARWLSGDAPRVYPDGPAGKLVRLARRRSTAAVIAFVAAAAAAAALSATISAYRNDPERARERIARSLDAGRLTTLVADQGPPPHHRLSLGAESTHLSAAGNRPFSVSTHNVALVELWRNPPPIYRFEVEMRHDDNPASGTIGVYFDHCEPSTAVNYPTCYVVRFADRGDISLRPLSPGGPLGTRVGLSFQHFEPLGSVMGDQVHSINERITHIPPPPSPNPTPWRRLQVDVGSQAVAIRWLPGAGLPDQVVRLGEAEFEQVKLLGAFVPALGGYQGRPAVRGAIGLYVSRSSGSFRNASLSPLFEEP